MVMANRKFLSKIKANISEAAYFSGDGPLRGNFMFSGHRQLHCLGRFKGHGNPQSIISKHEFIFS